ncbi:alpha/beta hydrolase [Streptococcus sp. S784/96/1]|uniref:alpha/beta hydrolase n=1 Tax=Streptococcus sp. S784/96/1 TaxID=2653499 RepID=UPI001389D13C|nr:alpha/beta hydrolase [Streptococcus sp. S784/96/1]
MTKTFEIYSNIQSQNIRFRNRFGIEVAGDLYLPVGYETQKNPAIVVSGPFGAVKEQVSGLYAQEFAKNGFVALAFDPSFTGESGGAVRNVAEPVMFTEDYSAAVDYLGTLPYVDRERIGAKAICGLSGMALTAAGADTRIKAVATTSMYDMSKSMYLGYMNSYTDEQKAKLREHVSQQRWEDVDNGASETGHYSSGYHELGFNADGCIVTGESLFPEKLPEDADPVSKAFFDYYCTPRGYHERSINSTAAWTATTPMSFYEFPLCHNIKDISPRPVLFVTGENAHSRYHSEEAYEAANEPKELLIVPNADHVDLYDQKDKIPFDKLVAFFTENLK